MPVSAVRVLRVIADAEQNDAELLGRFIDCRDETAFALLVRRHGAMVYGVCRRVLPDHDAEDAFQAVFLVLAQKARTVIPREAVGNWLYGVARKAALLSRRSIARRREQMGDVPEQPASQSDGLRAMLDEELSRLPDAYRTVIVLCDLEGRTRREAAVMLGWPEGTVAGRLVRARELLAKRLAPCVSIAALVAGTASARVPEILPPTAAIPTGVAALTREVLGAMVRGKMMKAATVVLLLACAGFGFVLQAGQDKPSKDAPVLSAPVNPPKADDVVWGKEVDGLQAGLFLKDGRTYKLGAKVELVVKLRNVGKADVTVFQPGDHDPLVRFGDGTAAIAVCADIGTPAHAQRAADRGADAYLASMFVIPSDYDGEVAKLSGYAAQHGMLTALANFGGPSGCLRSAGRSAIWSEAGERLAQLDESGSGIAVVTETRRVFSPVW